MQIQTQKIEIDPRVIKHLGSDLITSSDVAVTELIKNSIDARSKFVSLHLYDCFNIINKDIFLPYIKEIVPNKYLQSPVFILEDGGIGMNEHQLTSGFLCIGTSIKSTNDGFMLGEKGIGRLAAQRLGSALLVETVSSDDPTHVMLAFIDWEKVVSGETTALCATEKIEPSDHYTRLWILDVDLNDFLDLPHQIRFENETPIECNQALRSSISFLISPFEKCDNEPEIRMDYNGCNVDISFMSNMLSLSESTHHFELDPEKKMLHYGLNITPWFIERIHLAAVKSEAFKRLKKPHSYYETLLSDNKEKILTVLERSLSYNELLNCFIETYSSLIPCPNNLYKENYEKIWSEHALESLNDLFEITPITSKIFSYKQNASIGKDIIIDSFIEQKKRIGNWEKNDENIFTLKNLKYFLENYNGIKLYRNNFRIGFLGDKENDWVKLQQFRTKGQQWYRFDLGNTVGYVSLNDPFQKKIMEISSRLDIKSGPHSDSLKIFVNIIFNQLFYELNRTADAIIKNILSREGLLNESISKRVEKNNQSIKKMIQKNKQMLKMIGNVTNELFSEAVFTDKGVVIPQKRFDKAEALLNDVNKQATENVEVSVQTAELLAEANEQLKVIEVETYNNFKLMANGLITETITHELHSVSKTSVNPNIPEYFDFLKNYFFEHKNISDYNQKVYPIKNGYEAILSKIISVSDLYSFLETTFIKKGTYDEFVNQNINQTVNVVYKNLTKSISLKCLEMRCTCDNLIWLAPKGVLIHVFYNLFSNSLYWINKRREYAQAETIYRTNEPDFISVEPCGNNSLIVYDSGTGVLPIMQDILFDSLQSGKPNNEGRGMGLYIVKKLMNSFGGDIELLNELNGYGNRYKFLINVGENDNEGSFI